MRSFCMRKLLVVSFLIFSVNYCMAEENLPPGRYLPNGSFQPRNLYSTIHYQDSLSEIPFDSFTQWGDDIRLTDYGDLGHAHNSEVAVFGDYIYVAWWYLSGDTIFVVNSPNGGLNWSSIKASDDSTQQPVVPQIAVSDSNVYVVYRAGRPLQGIYMSKSSDWGVSWSPRKIYETARNYGEKPVVASRDSTVYVVAAIEVDYVNHDWDFFHYRSHNYGDSWQDTFFVSDSAYLGIGPDLALGNSGLHLIRSDELISNGRLEVLYNGSSDGGESWHGPTMLSEHDDYHSFWPQIAAWGDSNVIVSWTDYIYSPYDWTGDAFVSRSTDNGHTWIPPLQLTFDHGVHGTDITASRDTVLVAYDDNRTGRAVVYAIASFDGGINWEGELRVSDSPYECIEPSVAIGGGRGHISWSDSRHAPNPGTYEVYYDQGNFATGILADKTPSIPNDILSITAYPNPFNSATTITLTGAVQAEIGIYDITGRLISTLHAIGGQALWDARAYSSGLYFARVNGEKAGTIILVLVK